MPVEAPPPSTKPSPAPVDPWRERDGSERRAIKIGLVGTLLVHLLLFVVMSRYHPPLLSPDGMEREYNETPVPFDINLMPDEEAEAQPKRPFRFVEVNPDAPENEPDREENFGARNTQAAQPVPGKDNADRAKTEGPEKDSTAVVTGSHAEPMEAPPPGGGPAGPPGPQITVTGPQQPAMQENPLPGFEKITGDNPDGIGTNIGEKPENAKDDGKKQEGEKDAENPEPSTRVVVGGGASFQPGHPGPRPRPKLQNVRPAVLADQPQSASNAGVASVDSRLTAAGVWWQEFVETVSAEWNRIVDDMTTRPPSNAVVTVRFTVNAKGEIAQILEVQGVETAGKAATYACTSAIKARAPYRPWTDDMKAMFNEEEEVVFRFYYW